MIERWFNVFTLRRGVWVSTPVPVDEHLWDFLVAMQSRVGLHPAAGLFTVGP